MKHAQQENLITPELVLETLRTRHFGKAKGVTATKLVLYLTDRTSAAEERRLRACVEQLCKDGHPICALPQDGYFYAATPEEVEEACQFLRSRSMTTLTRESALRRVALPELLGQVRLDLQASAETATQGEPNEPVSES